jgi:hypothetical protein
MYPSLKTGRLGQKNRCRNWLLASFISMLLPAIFQTAAQDALATLNNNVANDAVSAVEVFSAGNTVAAGSFRYDNPGPSDVKFNTFKLPLSHKFGSPTNGFRPLIESYLGYFDLKQDIYSFGPPTGELRVQSWTGTVGGGVDWRINDWLSLVPRFMLAYSHVWQTIDRDVPPSDPTSGLLQDWNANALSLLPSLELKAKWTLGRWDLGFDSRYTYIRVLGLNDNSALINLNSDSDVWRNEVSAHFQSSWTIFAMPLGFYTSFARHDLAGQIRHSDFVEHFYEARVGFTVLVPTWAKPVRDLDVSAAYYFEGPLSGYSLGLGLDF